MEKILTVVVPAYNVEKYIEQCLESFVSEEIMDIIQVIVVNDGSKDNTYNIAKKYESKYPNTFMVINKENGGHGSTINKGIELATGKYFKVVDGDDLVDKESLLILVEKLKKCNVDLVAHNFYTFIDSNGERQKQYIGDIEYNKVLNFNAVANKVFIGLSAMTIKTSIMQNNNIRIDENMYYVDMEYITFPIIYVNTLIALDVHLYLYRQALTSQSTSNEGLRKNIKNHYDVIFKMIDFLDKYLKSENVEKEKINYIENKIVYLVKAHYYIYMKFCRIANSDINNLKEFDRKVKNKNNTIYNLCNSSKSIRFFRVTRFIGYKYLLTIYQRLFMKVDKGD